MRTNLEYSDIVKMCNALRGFTKYTIEAGSLASLGEHIDIEAACNGLSYNGIPISQSKTLPESVVLLRVNGKPSIYFDFTSGVMIDFSKLPGYTKGFGKWQLTFK